MLFFSEQGYLSDGLRLRPDGHTGWFHLGLVYKVTRLVMSLPSLRQLKLIIHPDMYARHEQTIGSACMWMEVLKSIQLSHHDLLHSCGCQSSYG